MTTSQLFALAATLLSALFFVGGKLLIARYGMSWPGAWRWTLVSTGLCGGLIYLALGAPPIPWAWCLGAGLAGAMAHVAANQALAWGDATVLVPVSGAKPLMLIALLPLAMGQALAPNLVHACWLATLGIALTGLAPRTVHRHAPHPGAAFLLMAGSAALMAVSDVCGAAGTQHAGEHRLAAIAVWNMGMGVVPLATFPFARRSESPANRLRACALGVLFTVFIGTIALAFATAADPARAVAEVNILVAFRGVIAVLIVLALDRWLRTGLEPVPRWVHGLRLAGALVLAGAVAVAYAH
jgi:drug/metabolite transporter (DMT)-like permease